jgi:hypothetical protein
LSLRALGAPEMTLMTGVVCSVAIAMLVAAYVLAVPWLRGARGKLGVAHRVLDVLVQCGNGIALSLET